MSGFISWASRLTAIDVFALGLFSIVFVLLLVKPFSRTVRTALTTRTPRSLGIALTIIASLLAVFASLRLLLG